MKQYSSRVLRIIAGSYMAFPVLYLALIAVLFNVSVQDCLAILFTPFYWGLSFGAVIAGFGVWELRRWSWYLFFGVNAGILVETVLIWAQYGQAFHGSVAFFICTALFVGMTYRVAREVRVPYLFPRIRWWESNPRYRLAAPVLLRRKDGSVLEAEILDISVGGCFIKLRQDLLQDEPVSLNFSMFDLPIACGGNIVWRAMSTVTHPKGVGVRFEPLSRMDRRSLQLIGRRLRQVADLYRRQRHLLSPEEFQRELDRLEHIRQPDQMGADQLGEDK